MNAKLKNKAAELMKHNKVEKLYLTSDGNFFLTKNAANNHALREHGKIREKALKVSAVKASDVGLADDTKSVDELMKEYEVLSEKKDAAVKEMLAKKEAKVFAEKDLKDANKEQKEAKEKSLKDAETAFKEAEKAVEKLNESLEKLEEEIDKTE